MLSLPLTTRRPNEARHMWAFREILAAVPRRIAMVQAGDWWHYHDGDYVYSYHFAYGANEPSLHRRFVPESDLTWVEEAKKGVTH